MNTHADQTQENKSQAVSAVDSQMQSGGESTFQFVDNRPEAVAQRKLQEMANNSSQVSQLRAFQDMANNSPQAKQAIQLQSVADNHSVQQEQPIQKKENNTGLPDNLKTGMENLSGMSLDDVKVHKNSDKPAQLQAHAYAQGTDIHLGPGQEKHLPHEAWHVVQQKQGRVKPTMQMKGKVNVNDDAGLEKEADVMGQKALQTNIDLNNYNVHSSPVQYSIVQRNLNDDVSPSYIVDDGEDKSLTRRGLVETEMVDDKKYVRAYQTVYAEVDKDGGFKDVHQEGEKEGKKIKFLGKGDTWINFGRPLRALHYVRTYSAQGIDKRAEETGKIEKSEKTPEKIAEINRAHGKPIIRSFLIPHEVYLEITGEAISESQREKLGMQNLSVDKSKAPDQYQVLSDDVDKLKDSALEGSLVSYVLDDHLTEYQDGRNGVVKGVNELSEKLGLPGVFDPLLPEMEGSKVPSAKSQAEISKELSELYDLTFFAEKIQDNPAYAKSGLNKNQYWDLYVKHEARISELSQKYLKENVLPDTKKERDTLRKKLAAAADASLIPSLLEEVYYEGTAKMHGQEKDKDGQAISSYMQQQTFETKSPTRKEKKEKKKALTDEEIKKLKAEAAKRKAQKEKEASEKPKEEDPIDYSALAGISWGE